MVEIINLSKSFNGSIVLDGLNLQLKDGEVHSVIGQSGAGKTVLVKTIIGLLKPDDGKIIIDNENVLDCSEDEMNEKIRIKIGMVYQNGALWDSMTIGENLKLVLKIKKILSEEEMDLKVKESLEMVELPDFENKYPEELSGGMKKRISVARAIIMKPKYIIYDEPTTGLDPVLINTIDNLIIKLNKEQNITSLVISHNIKSAERISDRISMIYSGKIIHTCTADKLWEQDNEKFNKFIHGDINFQ
jgi:phospholipid/cholesterol/gamma-HCH transport system ATP-binding protein